MVPASCASVRFCAEGSEL